MKLQRVNTDLLVGVTAGLVGLAALVFFCKWLRTLRHLPPGPWGRPVTGIMYQINRPMHEYLQKLAEEYGRVFSYKMGQETVVVLADHKLIKSAFTGDKMSARPKTQIIKDILKGLGIVNSEGNLWKETRGFLKRKHIGMSAWGGTRSGQIERAVRGQIRQLVSTIDADFDGVPVDPTNLFNCAISNVICSMVMSRTFKYTDPQFLRFMSNFEEGFRLFMDTGAVMFMPWLKYLAGVSASCKKLHANREEMVNFVRQVINEHIEQFDVANANPRDLIEHYLVEMNNEDSEMYKRLFQDRKPMEQLEQVVLDLFSAGVETLKTSLLWSVVYMLRHPEVLRKVQAELDSVVGIDNLPQMEHECKLPYTKATLYEAMRCSSVVPMGTTHSTNRTLKFEGYEIPKNTHIIPLICAVHKNPETFPQPEEFRPERFLADDGTRVFKPDGFMPFGHGQRRCLGDQLAENQLFLLYASIMHVFSLSSQQTPTLESVAGAAVAPVSFEVIFNVRNPLAVPRHSDSLEDRNNEQQA